MTPLAGRWLSPDPVGGDVSNPQSLNRYAYVGNNPTSLSDPLGLIMINPCYFDPGSPDCIWAAGGGGRGVTGTSGFILPSAAGGDGNSGGGGGGGGGTKTSAPGLPAFTQQQYNACAQDAFGTTSGPVDGSDAAIPSYDYALATFQAGLLTGVDPASIGATLALERATTILNPPNIQEPNGTISYGPADINSANFNAPWVLPGTFGTNLGPSQNFNGDPLANISTGGRLLARRGVGGYVGRGTLARRRLRNFLNIIGDFRKFFGCLSQKAAPG